MILIDGKKEAALLREELKDEVSSLRAKYNKVPGLTVILIGDLTPSQIYVRNKEKSANEVGLKSEVIKYPDNVEEKVVLDKIEELNKDDSVSGILVQLPLPKHIDKQKVIEAINPSKDVDGFHPMNVGNLSSGYESSVPCTPLGCYLLIKKIEKWRKKLKKRKRETKKNKYTRNSFPMSACARRGSFCTCFFPHVCMFLQGRVFPENHAFE